MNANHEEEVLRKARELGKLPPGWCQGYEIPPTDETVRHASALVQKIFARGLNANVFPGDENTIVVTAHQGKRSLDIAVSGSQYVYYIEELGMGSQYSEEDYEDFPSAIRVECKLMELAKGDTWTSSEYWTTESFLPKKGGSIPMRSEITKEGSPPLSQNVPKKPQWRRANISDIFIGAFTASHPSSWCCTN